MAERFLLCRPWSGFNDALCQIELCYGYARRFGRTLLIEFAQNSLMEAVFDCLEFLPGRVAIEVGISEKRRSQLRQMTAFPSIESSQLEPFRYSRGSMRTLETKDGRETELTPLTFSLYQNYATDLLVHQTGGGGTLSFSALGRLRLKRNSWEEILEEMPRLPETYDALHIRATDISIDADRLLEHWRMATDGTPLLLCSDNNLVLEGAHRKVPSSVLITFPPHTDNSGRPLHLLDGATPNFARQSAIRLLREFVALAHCRRFFYGFLDEKKSFQTSGFSSLIAHANFHRSHIAFFQQRPENWGFPQNGYRGRNHPLMNSRARPAWLANRTKWKLSTTAGRIRRAISSF